MKQSAHQLLVEKAYRKPLRDVLVTQIRLGRSVEAAAEAINARTGLSLVRNTLQVWMRQYHLTSQDIKRYTN